MKVSQLGEFGLIDLLADIIDKSKKQGAAWKNLIIGIGDDCAAWRCQSGSQLATADALVQGVHFELGTISWQELGWKSLAINISDIAAMGGVPRYALVSLGLPEETAVENMTSLYSGMLDLADKYEVAIVGGNVTRSPVVSINITVLGKEGPSGRLLTRSGGRAGDKIAVTGRLGGAAAGLRLLTGGEEPKVNDRPQLREAFVRPLPRVSEGLALAENGVQAAIDLSDGLVSDLGHVCKASKLGAQVNVDSLPLAEGLKESFPDRAMEWALGGGEDYELLFTAPARTIEVVKAALDCPVTVVGQMVKDPSFRVSLADKAGNEFHPVKAGWDHFSR